MTSPTDGRILCPHCRFGWMDLNAYADGVVQAVQCGECERTFWFEYEVHYEHNVWKRDPYEPPVQI